MAKKKAPVASGITEARCGTSIPVAPFFADALETTNAKLEKKGNIVDQGPPLILPVPSLGVRWMLQMEGWPLSRVTVVSGAPKSYKSTFAIEVGRWHQICNGFTYRCEAENKENEILRNSVLRWENANFECTWCGCMEDWQQRINWFTDAVQKKMDAADSPGRTSPLCLIVDSLSGVATTESMASVDKLGYAARSFPSEALSISKFLKTYPSKLPGWPFTFLAVNHVKYKTNAAGGQEEYEPGGLAIPYQMAYDIRMRRMGKNAITSFGSEVPVKLFTVSNTFGVSGKQLETMLTFWNQEDAPGMTRLHSRFEWWAATTQLLCNAKGMTKDEEAILKPKVKEIAGIMEKNCGQYGKKFWSKRMGVNSDDPISAHDMGLQLEYHPDILAELYSVLGISRYSFFQPGVDFLSLQEGQEFLREQSEQARTHTEILQQLVLDGRNVSTPELSTAGMVTEELDDESDGT